MKVQLLGWASEGLRCPDVKVNLADDSGPRRVALIQMPNGTGKTTTLIMIRAAMTGEAEHWDPGKVRSFQRSEETRSGGQFTLRLLIDGRPLTFEMSLDFDEGCVRYRTTSPGSGGVVSGWKPPVDVRRFLTDKFVGLFVFDGELADRLLDPAQSEAERAIDALCQLYLLDSINEVAEQAWQRATRDKGAKTQVGLAKWQRDVAQLEKHLSGLEKAAEKGKSRLALLGKEIDELKKQIGEGIGTEEKARGELEEKKYHEQKARERVERSAAQTMSQIRQPHLLHPAFRRSLKELKVTFDRLKLPESTSRQFFIELAQERECICNRPLDEQSRGAILSRADLYFGEEISGVLNTLKQDIDLHLVQEGVLTAEDLSNSLDQLKADVRELALAVTGVRALEKELLEKSGEEIRRKKERLDKNEKDKAELEDLLEELNRAPRDTDDEDSRCMAAIKNLLREAKKKVAEITDTVDLRERTRILQEIAQKARQQARENIRKVLIKECNNRLEVILSREPVRIEDIGRSLRLRNQEGASVGQTLSVGYTFLTSLLNRGQHQFPLVVDSPANPLDANVRREIGALVPELCTQFVGFTISTEREGFVSALHKKCKGNIKYITLFRKTPGTEYLQNGLPRDGVVQTSNAVLVEGKDYFDQFDLEEE